MKNIPRILVEEMKRDMGKEQVPRVEQVDWFKWLKYYLDFCYKYGHSTRNPETEVLFLQKISSKGQDEEDQKQASRCIAMFREVAKRFPATGQEQDQVEELSDWGQVLVSLEQILRSRLYSRNTSRTYRNWTIQFQEYLKNKAVAQVNDDDAVDFLS